VTIDHARRPAGDPPVEALTTLELLALSRRDGLDKDRRDPQRVQEDWSPGGLIEIPDTPVAMALMASSGYPGTPSFRATNTSSGGRSARATS
jgi:hypothetical protein